MLDAMIRQSGLHMDEVLRRQRRKKRFFYEQMRAKFGVFWNQRIEDLSLARDEFGSLRPSGQAHKKKLQLFALKSTTDDIHEVLKECVNEIWGEYDKDGSGVLEREETRTFVTDILKGLGINNGQFSDHDFEITFRETDLDGNGVISKSEMRHFIKNVAGL